MHGPFTSSRSNPKARPAARKARRPQRDVSRKLDVSRMLAAAVSNGLESLESRRLMSTTAVANPGGPYVVNEGNSVVLDASASTGAAGYKWDLNYDGTFNTTVTGKKFTYKATDNFGGTRTIALRAFDANGQYDTITTTLAINDVAPSVTLTGASNVDEAAPYAISWSATDPGKDTISSWVVDWNDGSAPQTFAGTATGGSHVYDDAGSYTIKVTAVDEDGPHGPAVKAIVVNNVAPVVAASGAATVDEGATYTVNFSATQDEVETWVVDWGDDNIEVFNDPELKSAGHVFADNGPRVITVTAVSTDGDSGEATVNVLVKNVAPVVTDHGAPSVSVAEGTSIHHTLTVTDAGADDTTFTYAWTVEKGGEPYYLPDEVVTNDADFTWTPGDNGEYVVTVVVTDDDDGATIRHSKKITVTNVAPTGNVTGAPGGTIAEGTNVTLTANPSDAGADDTFAYAWTVKKDGADYALPGDVSIDLKSFTFAPGDNGTYVATCVITDDDGATVAVQSAAITAVNAAPAATIDGAPANADEGDAIEVSADVTDAGTDDTHSYAWSVEKIESGASGVYNDGDPNKYGHVAGYQMAGSFTLTGRMKLVGLPESWDSAIATFETEGDPMDPGSNEFLHLYAQRFNGYRLRLMSDVGTVNVELGGVVDPAADYFDFAVVADADTGTAQFYVNGVAVTTTGAFGGAAGTYDDLYFSKYAHAAFDDFRIYDAKLSAQDVADIAGDQAIATQAADAWSFDAAGSPRASTGTKHTAMQINGLLAAGSGTTATPVTLPAGTKVDGQAFTFVPADNGTYRIKLTVTDDDGAAVGTQTSDIVVANVAPEAKLAEGAPTTGKEGTALAFGSAATDAGSADVASLTHLWSVKKDGVNFALPGGVATNGPTFTFTPTDNGTYVVTYTVTDKDGGSGSTTASVAVANADPVSAITGAPSTHVDEGDTVSLGSSVTDAGAADTAFTYAWSVTKDGETYALPGGLATNLSTFSFVPGDDGEYVVKLIATDKDGGKGEKTAAVTVDNVDPTAAISGEPAPIAEGTPVTLTVAANDVADDTLSYAWSVEKDGEAFALPDGAVTDAASFTFTPTDDGSYVATVVVSDEDGGSVTKQSAAIVVNNQPPAVTLDAPTTGVEGTKVVVGSTVTDSGVNDTHTYAWSVEKKGAGNGGKAIFSQGPNYGTVSGLSVADAFTLVARLKLLSSDSSGVIAQSEHTDGNGLQGWRLIYDNSGTPTITLITFLDGQDTSTSTTQAVPVDQEFDLALAFDTVNASASLYIDGQPAALTGSVLGGMPSSSDLLVGVALDSEFDSLGIYNELLDDAQVETLHDGDAIAPAKAYDWQFNDADGATSAANSGTSANGTMGFLFDGHVSNPPAWTPVTLPGGVAVDGESFEFVPTDNGTYRVKLTVTDNGGLSTTKTSGDIVVSNANPTATITGVEKGDEGTAITLGADAADAGSDDTLAYAWSVKKAGADYGIAGTGSTYTFTPDDNGSYVVTLVVTDDDGGTVTTTKTIAVSNLDPVAAITGAPSGEVAEGTAVTLGSTASDAGTDTFSYAWSVTKDGEAFALPDDAVVDAASLTFTPTDNGAYVVKLVVSDEDGGEVEKTQAITVVNVDPTAAISGAPVTPVAEGASVELTAVAADAGAADTFGYAWSVTKDGEAFALPDGAVTDQADFTFVPTDDGLYVATVVVSDDDGGEKSVSTAAITVANADPTASITDAPATADEGATINVGSIATDAGADDTLDYAWTVEKQTAEDGWATVTLPEGTPVDGTTFAFVPTDNGTYRIKLVVTDDDGGSVTTDSGEIVVANVAPTAAIEGSKTGTEGSAISLTSEADDAGAADTLAYAWSVEKDGEAYTLPEGVKTDGENFAFTPVDDGEYVVSLTVTDKDGAASEAVSHTVTVANAKPTASIAATGSAVEASPMTFTVTAADVGTLDTLAYAWSVKKDGKAYALPNDLAVDGTSLTFTPDDNGSYVVSCVVTDKDGGAFTATKTVAIANVKPTGELSAAPTGVVEGGTVSFSVTASDVAGAKDTIGYAWSVERDGKAIALPGTVSTDKANFTFVASDNGSYVVTCVVSDEDGGSVGIHSSAFSVANAAPTLTLTGGTTSAARNREVNFVGTLTDAGTDDTHSYAWDFGDGVKLKGGTVRTHAYAAPGTYTVSMTATDKDGASVTKTQQVTVNIAASVADPADASKQALIVGGTEGADSIKINSMSADRVKLYVGGEYVGSFTVTGNIYVYAGDGDNSVVTQQSVVRNVYAFGGNGRDTFVGGAGNDVLLGGRGNDAMFGWSGGDVLIGGEGADSLFGEAGDDLAIGGATAHDGDLAAIAAVAREWARTDISHASRQAHVRGTLANGLNGSTVLTAATVFSDTSIDKLSGGDNRDWFFATTAGLATVRDSILDLASNESVN